MLRCYILIRNLLRLLLLLDALKWNSIRVIRTQLTLSLWIKVKKIQFQNQEVIFESEVSHAWPKLNHANEQKTGSNVSEKWRHTDTSVEIAWTNEQTADLKWLWCHMVVSKIGSFPFVISRLVGAYYLHTPDARAIFLHNDLLCNERAL